MVESGPESEGRTPEWTEIGRGWTGRVQTVILEGGTTLVITGELRKSSFEKPNRVSEEYTLGRGPLSYGGETGRGVPVGECGWSSVQGHVVDRDKESDPVGERCGDGEWISLHSRAAVPQRPPSQPKKNK